MENIATNQRAFRFATDYYDHPTEYEKRDKAIQVAKKLGVTINDLKAAKEARDLPTPEKNKIMGPIIDKLAQNSYAEESLNSPVGHIDRFKIKNLIDEDPDLQINYLNRKGYEARFNSNGELEARRKGEYFRLVDPSQFEFEDVIDVIGDLVQMGLEGFASMAPGWTKPIVAGGVAGAYELGKQELAKLAGLRDDNNYARVASKVGLGVVFPLLPIIPGGVPDYIASSYKNIPKENADEIIRAGQKMGVVPTKGMLSDNIRLQESEDWLAKQPIQTISSKSIQEHVTKNIKGTDAYAKELLKDRIPQSRVDIAEGLRGSISSSLQDRKDYAEELYDYVESRISKSGYQVNTDGLNNAIKTLQTKYFKFIPEGRNWSEQKLADLDNISNISDLRGFITSLDNDFGKFQNQPKILAAITSLRKSSKNLVDETFDTVLTNMENAAKQFVDNTAYTPQMKNKLGSMAQERLDDIAHTRNKLIEANKIWRDINEESNVLIKNIGKDVKGGIGQKIDKIDNMPIEELFKKVINEGDYKKSQFMAEKYPEEFNQARGVVLNDIFRKAKHERKGKNNKTFASSVNQQIKAMSDSKKMILFGRDGIEKADALALWFSELPSVINPSSTSIAKNITEFISSNVNQGLVRFRTGLGNNTKYSRTFVKGLGDVINNPATRGGSFYLGSELAKPFTSSEQSQQSKLPLIPME